MGEKCFLVWVTYYDGIHEHSYRGLMRGKSEEDVCERAHEKAVPHFGFFEYRPGDEYYPRELEDESAAIEVSHAKEVTPEDYAMLQRLSFLSDLDVEP